MGRGPRESRIEGATFRVEKESGFTRDRITRRRTRVSDLRGHLATLEEVHDGRRAARTMSADVVDVRAVVALLREAGYEIRTPIEIATEKAARDNG